MVKRSDILYTNNIQLYLISNSKKSKVKIKIIRQTSIRSFETSSKTRSFDQSNHQGLLRNLEIYSRDAHQGFRAVEKSRGKKEKRDKSVEIEGPCRRMNDSRMCTRLNPRIGYLSN